MNVVKIVHHNSTMVSPEGKTIVLANYWMITLSNGSQHAITASAKELSAQYKIPIEQFTY